MEEIWVDVSDKEVILLDGKSKLVLLIGLDNVVSKFELLCAT